MTLARFGLTQGSPDAAVSPRLKHEVSILSSNRPQKTMMVPFELVGKQNHSR